MILRRIGLICGVLLAALLGAGYVMTRGSEACMVDISRAVKSAQDVDALDTALRKQLAEKGSLPAQLAQLAPAYISRIPVDPWGHDYQYRVEGSASYRIYAFGKDGREGGSGAAADLVPGMRVQDIIDSIQGFFECH